MFNVRSIFPRVLPGYFSPTILRARWYYHPSLPPMTKPLPRLILIGILGLFFLTVTYFMVLHPRSLPYWLITHRILILSLWYVDILLLALLFTLFIRYLIKLFMEQRFRRYEATLRKRIFFSFMAILLIPIFYLFAMASDLILHTYTLPPSNQVLLEEGVRLAEGWQDILLSETWEGVSKLARALKDRPPSQWLPLLQAFLKKKDISAIQVFQESQLLISLQSPLFKQSFPVSLSFVKEALNKGKANHMAFFQDQWFLQVGLRQGKHSLVVWRHIPKRLGEGRKRLLTMKVRTETWVQEQKHLQTSKLLFFGLLTLGVLFGGFWYSIYISGKVTQPMGAFMEATEKVASGDLTVRIPPEASEEWNRFVHHFNHMVEELSNTRGMLEAEKDLLQAIIDHIPVGIILMDQTRNKIIRYNHRAKELLGNLLQLPHVWQGWQGMVEHEERILTVQPVRFRESQTLYVLEDVTLLMQAKEMATWRDAARQIAHELKNPLTPIQLSMERLGKKVRDPEVQRACKITLQEVENLKQLVENFVQFARLPKPKKIPLSMKELFAPLKERYTPLLKDFHVRWDIHEEDLLDADPQLFPLILRNLLDNAREACQPGDTIEIRANRERMEVRDSGRGIPPELKGKILRAYVSTKSRGSGLGLAIVEQIVQAHGWRMVVEDNLPKGTCFRILF